MGFHLTIFSFIATWFMANYSIFGQARRDEESFFDELKRALRTDEPRDLTPNECTMASPLFQSGQAWNDEESIFDEIKRELRIARSKGIRDLTPHECTMMIPFIQLKYETLRRKYVEIDSRWNTTYTNLDTKYKDLNKSYILVEAVAKHWRCSKTVRCTMEEFPMRGLGNEHIISCRREKINNLFGTAVNDRKVELLRILNIISRISDVDAQSSKFKQQWEQLKEMLLNFDDTDETEYKGNPYLHEAIFELNEATSIEEACTCWKKHNSVWKLMTQKWKINKKGDVTAPWSDEQAVKEVTESLKNTLGDLAGKAKMSDSEKAYINTVLTYQHKNEVVPKHFKECAWVCHRSEKPHIQQAIDKFKNLDDIREEMKEKSKSEIIYEFCVQYHLLDQVVSQADFHCPGLKEYPEAECYKLTDEEIESYVEDVAGTDKLLSATLRIILSLTPTLSKTTTPPI